jgi:ATP-binding protein involved in chromosome partitioning
VTDVKIDWGEMTSEERSAVMTKARWNARENAPNTEVSASTRILAIASGKGGVGKSSVTVNLAAAIAGEGFTVGVLDADIWGFSVPRLLGIDDRLEAQAVDGRDKPMIIPRTLPVGRGMLKVVSTGFLVEEDTALMWRGLMLNKAVEQFLRDVHWGELDYLFIDMPPGTGDVQMGLARMLPRTDLLIVTTPAVAAQKVAARAADMARRSFLRVCGVIENMSSFTCEHGVEYALFGTGGGQVLANEIGVDLLGQVPLETAVAAGGDAGRWRSKERGWRQLSSGRLPARSSTRLLPRSTWPAARHECCHWLRLRSTLLINPSRRSSRSVLQIVVVVIAGQRDARDLAVGAPTQPRQDRRRPTELSG